jgi:hypothetical protein
MRRQVGYATGVQDTDRYARDVQDSEIHVYSAVSSVRGNLSYRPCWEVVPLVTY